MSNRTNRPGFAMPLALMVLMFVTVGVATAFTRVQSELRAGQSRQAETDAFAYAQSGLERFIADRRNLGFTTHPPPAWESTRIALPGGFADVVSRRVRAKTPTAPAVYSVRSRGTRQTGAVAWMPRAEHVVSQYAQYREGSIQILSAWTSLSGLLKNGSAGTIDGTDNCSTVPPVAGVAVPNGKYTQNGGAGGPTGNPPILYMGDQAQSNAYVKIDWNAIINQNAILPTHWLPKDAYPTGTYGSSNWPIVRVDGNFSLPSDGQGLLIVTGNLTINGSLKWAGVVLVGGTIYADGNNNVLGGVISALNEKLGMTVPVNDVGNGTKTYRYDSCNVANAVSSMSSLVLLGKTWSNNWPNW